jgi:hypothetical protein
MLAVEDSYMALVILLPHLTMILVENKLLSFDEKWVVNEYFNANDFDPKNSWTETDSWISDVNPQMLPILLLGLENNDVNISISLKTKFAPVDDIFCRSGVHLMVILMVILIDSYWQGRCAKDASLFISGIW